MSKIGRNDSCPCGSNKKYKKCCKLKEPFPKEAPKVRLPQKWLPMWIDDEDHLTRDTNLVVDLIHEGRLDEAEEGAKKLLIDYPEVNDGFDRLAMVYEKRGNYIQAIEMYQKALEFVLNEDCDYDDMRDFFKEQITRLSK